MEDITTELKLKIAQLEKEKQKSDEKCISVLKENDRLISSLMVDIATYKNKMAKVKKRAKALYESGAIDSMQYAFFLEELSD